MTGAKGVGASGAALVLGAAGLLTALLSSRTWAWCPTTPCGGSLMAISEYSGFDLGFGAVTAVAGAGLAVIGATARRGPVVPRLATAAALLAVLIVVTAGASVIWMYVLPGDDKQFHWPPWLALIIGIVGVIALAASASLRRNAPTNAR